MKLLLDTHTFLWHAEGSSSLSAYASALLVDPANDLYLGIEGCQPFLEFSQSEQIEAVRSSG